MYLLVLNKDNIRKTNTVTDSDKQMSKSGNINIIDISGDVPLVYVNDRWVEVSSVD